MKPILSTICLALAIPFSNAMAQTASPAAPEKKQDQSPSAPRDEFFWLGAMNKATVIINADEELLDKSLVPGIAEGLERVINDGGQPKAKRPSTVITFEPLLIEAAGQEMTLLHAGRSSQDMHATYRSAMLRDKLLELATQLQATKKTMIALAETHAETVVPNYTNGVAAQPNSYGHYLLGHVAALDRDAQRIREAYARIDRSSMGTTVLNGTSWPLNRQRMAQYLGFQDMVENAYDASQISSMDQPVEVAAIVTSIALHAGNFVEDLMTQYAQTRPWILLQEGGDNTYVSSAMPQKRNPGLLNSTRSAASTAVTLSMGPVLQTHNITPGMSDPKSVKQNAAMVDSGIDTLKRWERVLKALVIHPDRALEELNSDWTASQELADVLMRKYKLPFRVGHHVASDMVDHARKQGLTPLNFPYETARNIYSEAVKGTDYPAEFPMDEAEFRATLDPVSIVRNRATAGGPQPAEMQRMLATAGERQAEHDTWIQERKAYISDALNTLDQAFKALLPKADEAEQKKPS